MDTMQLLATKQMARFVADGYLVFEALIPDELNQAAIREIAEHGDPSGWTRAMCHPRTTFDEMWRDSPGIGRVFRLPDVRGIIHSLVGPSPTYDSSYPHVTPPQADNMGLASTWHQDNWIETGAAFDVVFLYFPQDTPPEMGGTLILPGSHLRVVNNHEVSKHQNFLGQKQVVCPAGTLVVNHRGMWHSARPNLTDRPRYMFKLRLRPSVPQRRLWDMSDVDDPEVPQILASMQPWTSYEFQLEIVNRVKLWRYLTGDDSFDFAFWS